MRLFKHQRALHAHGIKLFEIPKLIFHVGSPNLACKGWGGVVGASPSEPHTSESNGAIFIYYWGELRSPHTCG